MGHGVHHRVLHHIQRRLPAVDIRKRQPVQRRLVLVQEFRYHCLLHRRRLLRPLSVIPTLYPRFS